MGLHPGLKLHSLYPTQVEWAGYIRLVETETGLHGEDLRMEILAELAGFYVPMLSIVDPSDMSIESPAGKFAMDAFVIANGFTVAP